MNSVNRAWRAASSLAFILTLLTVSHSPANAENSQVAQIKTVSGQAEIVRNGARTVARVGDPLFEKDTIETGPDGSMRAVPESAVAAVRAESRARRSARRPAELHFHARVAAQPRAGDVFLCHSEPMR